MLTADERVFRWINGFVGTWPWFDNVMRLLVSDFFLPVLIAGTTLSLWLMGRTLKERLQNHMGFIYATGGAGFANLIIRFINEHLDRSRPFVTLDDVNVLFYRPTDPSFPSNAAAYAFAMAAGVWLVNRRMGVIVGVGAVLFAFARVYAGMHYPLDVVGGALVGILVTWAFHRVLSLLHPLVTVAFRVARLLFLT